MRLPALFESLRFFSSTQQTLGGLDAALDVPQRLELPGGTPFSLCPASRPSDLLRISSVELTPQPLYMCVASHTDSDCVDPSLKVTNES